MRSVRFCVGLLAGASALALISGTAHAQILPGGGTATPPAPPAAVIVSNNDAADLDSIQARAFLGLGQLGEARAAANDVLRTRPDDVPALTVLALAEETDDRWRHAATYWTRIYALNGDKAAKDRVDALKSAHPTQVMATGFYEGSDADNQFGVRASGAWRPMNGPEWTTSLETRRAEADVAVNLAGGIGPISLDRQRIDVGVADTYTFGRLALNMLAAQNGVGARASYSKTTSWGGVEVVGGVNESYWLYSAGIANEAKTNYVGASANLYFQGVGARLTVRESNFGVRDDDDFARSTRVTVGVDVPITQQPNPVRVSYVLDSENFSRVDQRMTTGGFTYAPIPFADREVHSLGVFKAFGDVNHNNLTLGAGYRKDRWGADGAFVSATGEAEVSREIRLGARLEYSQTSIRGLSEDSYSFGEVYVRRVF